MDIFTAKQGCFKVDENTMRLTDDYCSFYLHKCNDPGEHRLDWYGAMRWAKENGYELPDRWQALTISRYKDEVRHHFHIVDDNYLPTKESWDISTCWGAWYSRGGIYYLSKQDCQYTVFGVSE